VASEKTVLYSAMLTLTSTTAASMLPDKYGGKGEIPSPRLLFGTAITFTGLSILADFQPKLGNSIAAAVAVTALVYYGFPLIDNYIKISNNPSQKVKLTPVGKV
jgi:hypothetical protein